LGSVISNYNQKQPVTALIDRVREVGLQLIEAKPGELTIGNVLRRVLGLIKECAQEQSTEEVPKFDIAAYLASAPSNLTEDTFKEGSILLDTLPIAPTAPPTTVPANKLVRDIILDAVSGIDEILDELDSTAELVADLSPSYISPTDVVLIQGQSTLSHRFLAHAAGSSTPYGGFVVFAIDDGTGYSLPETVNLALTGKTITEEKEEIQDEDDEEDQDSVRLLAKLNVSVTILPQTAVFSIMPKITKVLIAPEAVLPDGSVLAPAGAASIVLAAKEFGVPVLSLSGTYHFCPVPLPPGDDGSRIGNTGYAVGLEEDEEEDSGARGPPDGVYYVTEPIQPDGIELYVTNM
jgi:translation initiation factor eIF-2B subunit beta